MLRVLRPDEDAFGHLLTAVAAGQRVIEVVERDDGCVFTGDPSYFLAPFRRWWPHERRAMRFVRGRVLDVGCGGGRVILHLQNRGLDVVGIDVSPLYDPYEGASDLARRYQARIRDRGKMGGVERSACGIASTQLPGTTSYSPHGTRSHSWPQASAGPSRVSSTTAPATSPCSSSRRAPD